MSVHPFIQRIVGEAQGGDFHRDGPVPRLGAYAETELAIAMAADDRWQQVLEQLLVLLPALEDDNSRIVSMLLQLTQLPHRDEAQFFSDMIATIGSATEEMLAFGSLIEALEALDPEAAADFSPIELLGRPEDMGRNLVAEIVGMSLMASARAHGDVDEFARELDSQMLLTEYTGMRTTFTDDERVEITEVLWRGDRHQVRPTHWIARRATGEYELLAPTEDGWHLIEGSVEDLVQCLPEPLFSSAVARLLEKEKL